MVAFPDTQWIQGYFSTLVSMFDRVGMWTNFSKEIRHGLPPVPGGGDAVGGGIREKDYGRGAFVTVEAEGSDPV